MKRKISLSFALLAVVFVLKLMGGVSWIFNPFRTGMFFRNIPGCISYVGNLICLLVPVLLMVLLHFNAKKSMAKPAGLLCLIAGGAYLYFTVKATISLVRVLGGGIDVYALIVHTPLMSILMNLFSAIGFLLVGLELFTATKSKGTKGLLILGAVLIIFVGLLRTVGHGSITEVFQPLLLMLALALLPPAYTDRSKCVMVSFKTLIILAVIIALLLIVPELLNSSPSTGGGTSSRTCGYCGRKFTDSSNKSSIARTNMCVNCYNNFKWASSAVGK